MSISKRFKACWTAGKRTVAAAVFCLLSIPLFSWAQQNKLTVSQPDQITAKRGTSVTENLKVTVLPGFHVNSDKPRDEFLIPLKLSWGEGPLQAASITYPKPEEIKVGNDMLLVFTGTFEIQTSFNAPDNAALGASTVNGKLRYQACNNEMCFRPASVDIHLPVVIQ